MMSKDSQLKQSENEVRILVVEDEAIVARDIKDSLENLGYTAVIASSGAEALHKAIELEPTLVLMDIRLKGEMDGIQAAQEIWQRHHIPIIYATGHSDRATLDRAKATGPFGYILKPLDERELFVAIETAIQRFRAEVKLQQREQWLTTILRDISNGVIVVDSLDRIKLLNVVAEHLSGWQQLDTLDRPLSDIVALVQESTQTPLLSPTRQAVTTGKVIFLPDQTFLCKDGKQIPIAGSAAPLRDDKGNIAGAVLIFRDTTGQQLAKEQYLATERTKDLEQQTARLEKLNRAKDEFLSTISHELRTPLANIKMAIEMLEISLKKDEHILSEATSLPSQALNYLDILRNQCNRELSIVNDLLDLQRLNTDDYIIEPQTIDLQHWIPHVAERFQVCAAACQVSLAVDVAADVPPIVSDSIALTRILTELLDNAYKFTPPNEQISITVQLQSWQPTASDAHSEQLNRVQIQVCNTGVEIPEDELPSIFNQFYRARSEGDRWAHGGIGLGLALVKKLATCLGGSITAESQTGQTCFTVTLPLQLSNKR